MVSHLAFEMQTDEWKDKEMDVVKELMILLTTVFEMGYLMVSLITSEKKMVLLKWMVQVMDSRMDQTKDVL